MERLSLETCLLWRWKLMHALQTLVYIRFLCKALADKIFWLLSGLSIHGEEQFIGWNSVAFVSISLKLLNFPVVLETNCFAAACWSLQTGRTPPHTHTRTCTWAAYLTVASSGFMWLLSFFNLLLLLQWALRYNGDFHQRVGNEQPSSQLK